MTHITKYHNVIKKVRLVNKSMFSFPILEQLTTLYYIYSHNLHEFLLIFVFFHECFKLADKTYRTYEAITR